MSMFKKTKEEITHVEDTDKDLMSLASSAAESSKAQRGIDNEVADFFAQHHDTERVPIDDATNTRLRRMVHRRVLVVMVVTYFAQTLDKGTINFASIMGIVEDTHLKGPQYAWLTTCVYIAILAWEFPTNRLLQRLPVAKYLGFNIMAWGAVLACTAACKNFVGLVVVRTLLGIFECVCQPAFVFLSTMWYKRSEQALIIGAFYSMNGFQQCVGGLIAYGISQVEGAAIKNWQILFTLLGCATFVWGIFVLWWLPDSPMRATCWSEEDRALIAERVRENETGIQNKEFKWEQVREALKDLTVWSVTIISFTNALPTGGLGAFSNIILNAFGFTRLQTYLLAIAQGAIIMTLLFSAAFLSTHFNQKCLFALAFTLPNVAGTITFLIVQVTPATKVGLLIAFYATQGFGAVATLNLSIMSNNVGGRTKQVVASTLVFVAWAVGNAIGPQVFRTQDAPSYYTAWITHIVMYGIQVCTIIFLRIRLMALNRMKRRKQALQESGESDDQLEHKNAFSDLTDWQNPDFRYNY